jgi:AcrR family transcriptional regulator
MHVPRAGLSAPDIVVAGAELADEIGYQNLTMGLLAKKLGIRPPSLYKHVESLAALQHAIAALALTELADELRDAMQGKSGPEALAAFASVFRSYAVTHAGRYAATVGAEPAGPDDPLLDASTRMVASIAAVLHGYGIRGEEMNHALRTIRCAVHGYAVLQGSNAFRWHGDPEESFDWMIRFIDQGLARTSG